MKLIALLKWWHWRMTGYNQLSDLIRHSSQGYYGALTPVGWKLMEELSKKETELLRELNPRA